MQLFRMIRRAATPAVAGALLLSATSVHASETFAPAGMPVLLAKSWAIGYALVFLAILLGLLAVCIPSMRKVLRKKEY
jgi:hypothetical protein